MFVSSVCLKMWGLVFILLLQFHSRSNPLGFKLMVLSYFLCHVLGELYFLGIGASNSTFFSQILVVCFGLAWFDLTFRLILWEISLLSISSHPFTATGGSKTFTFFP